MKKTAYFQLTRRSIQCSISRLVIAYSRMDRVRSAPLASELLPISYLLGWAIQLISPTIFREKSTI
jgi:hypothetical protein